MGPHSSQRPQPMSLLIRKLKFNTSPSMVRDKFKKFGAIKDVYLPIDYYTKEPRGFGFVEFYDPKDAEQALKEMNGSELDGNRIEVFVAQKGRSDPRIMRYKERGGGSGYGHRKYSDNRLKRRYISKSNSRYGSYSRDKIRRRDKSRERIRYRDSYERNMRSSYKDKKNNYMKNYNRYRSRNYDRSFSRGRRSRGYRHDSPKYREKRRYNRSISRSENKNNRKEYKSKYSNDKYSNDKYSNDKYSNDRYSNESGNSSKQSRKQMVSKSISFNTEKDDEKRKNDNIEDRGNSKEWKESKDIDKHVDNKNSVNSQDAESN
ncbi:serine/arginine-rich splicing factor 12, putative [Plasmodium berghei]|uniref:Serine/arginine-rich splicing factor 12, putative n=2 Tax=Plasmodium berghei TaxID=5821 RepID=A0A509ALL4_PLABA|nr:serine/arginine-rich splicing factor 12, putative [Plasmodium berghei ANKA]CXI59489.1 serine/arginine-rich splicing factor 12, putative [Plasmodium berghei]SCM23467.1 serine/arginine-rich splicing factor 12, putative [Plasmodium berghei]SCN26605.1 serine/arginine-rich splicing factor 12, putative [Plasmodium berghei]SCO60870.1 serine/arginine-rich splicing factor 12, putative [Plasmodium berghei]SCO62872.1 serine/arginine-rich splicing factor 12, putative [Plasmodium berghei]|eukprot:XP_034422239.1 serine/arginine-rich splicing factor 12, putative [Plasmodium berghei ANKA]